MPDPWTDLEAAFFAVRDDPLTRAWVHRESGVIRTISDVLDIDKPTLRDSDWIELPSLETLRMRTTMVEDFVHQYCPELALPVAIALSKVGGWRRFRDLLDLHGHLDHWTKFEHEAVRGAIREWATEHALSFVAPG